MPEENKYRDNLNRLTFYALACGYIEDISGEYEQATLDMEHGIITVSYYFRKPDCSIPVRREFTYYGKKRARAYRKFATLRKRIEGLN